MEILNTFMAHKRNPKQIHGAQITLPRTLPLYFLLLPLLPPASALCLQFHVLQPPFSLPGCVQFHVPQPPAGLCTISCSSTPFSLPGCGRPEPPFSLLHVYNFICLDPLFHCRAVYQLFFHNPLFHFRAVPNFMFLKPLFHCRAVY